MGSDLWVGIGAVAVSIAALVVALYAIRDVRKLVRRHVIEAQAYAVFVEAINRLCWEFITPTAPLYTPEMSALLGRFAQLEHELDAKRMADDSKDCIENEALVLAYGFVKNGRARWNDGIDVNAVEAQLLKWRTEKRKVHLRNIFGGSERFLP